jgi:outer membrane protein
MRIVFALILMMLYVAPARAELLPWLDYAVSDPLGAQEKTARLIAPNLKPDSCTPPPDFKRKLNFSDVVVAVMCNNPQTRASYLTLAAQGATYATNYSGYMPTVTGTVGASRTSAYGGGHTTSIARSSDVVLSMTLYDFGQREMKLDAAEQALLAAGHTFNSSLQGAIAAAMNGYYTLLKAQNALNVSLESARFAKESFDAATLRHQVGQVPLADVLTAKSSYSAQLLAILQSKNNLVQAQASLAQLMGQQANTTIDVAEVDDSSLAAEPFRADVDELMARAKEQRQDLLSSRAALKQSEIALGQQKRSNLGTIAATTDLDVGNNGSAYLLRSGRSRSQSVGLSVSIPIFTGFSNSYNLHASEKNLEAQREGLKNTELNVEKDVWNSWHNYQTAKESYKTSQDELISATQLRDVALGRYKEGLGTILDVLNAQTQYNNSLQSHLNSRYNVFTTRVDLVRSVGTLDLESISPQTEPAS